MRVISSQAFVLLLKLYVVAVLMTAAFLSPLAWSIVPILALAWYLFQWRWPVSPISGVLTECFIFFAAALVISPETGPYLAVLIASPVFFLVNKALETSTGTSVYLDTLHIRRTTGVFNFLAIIIVSLSLLALVLESIVLFIACTLMLSYLVGVSVIALKGLSKKPVEEKPVTLRALAGSKSQARIELDLKTRTGGLLFLKSPYEWVKIQPDILPMNTNAVNTEVTLTPDLSGPSVVKLNGQVVDRWGLFRINFNLEPITLNVVPRATYAAWLARKYLENTRLGTLPVISNMEALRPLYGLRRGIEYYGNQLYQPGDRLKNIDWKHSLQQNELISKEFAEFQGQPAIILINLVAGNAEEADKLAYNLIVTAISLSRENIPAALAAYDDKKIGITTNTMQSSQLLLQSLKLAEEITTVVNPVKYLNPPDVTRLRAELSRIRHSDNPSLKVLYELMDMEYKGLSLNARTNPVTKALLEVFGRVDRQSSIVVLSLRNHDAEALAFNMYSYERHGNAVITI